MKAVVAWLILFTAAAAVTRADDKSADFEEHTFAAHGGAKMPYRLLKPANVEAGKKYPLVLVLHGWGEREPTNQKQLKDFRPDVSQARCPQAIPPASSLCRRQMGRGCRTPFSTRRFA